VSTGQAEPSRRNLSVDEIGGINLVAENPTSEAASA
jgi:hypothetical protein